MSCHMSTHVYKTQIFLSLGKGSYLISIKMAENGFTPLYIINASLMRFYLSGTIEYVTFLNAGDGDKDSGGEEKNLSCK